MTVVFQKSTRKMTPKCTLIVLLLALGWLEGISTAAFSNVVVQRGPLDYINYNPAALSFNAPQLAQLTTGPLVSSVVSPCVAPCVIPNAPALATLPTATSAKIVAYNPQLSNLPVLLANKEEPRGYTYAYAVFDDQTGDKKTQSEHSDGSVVQGQYSFIQPDGFRRVVVYTADDLKGFNAVVKNISPEPEQPKEQAHEEKKEVSKPPPCTEIKNEHLTQPSTEDTSEETHPEPEHTEDTKPDEKSSEVKEVESAENNEKHDDHETTSAHEDAPAVSETTDQDNNMANAIVSYNDIINCLQSKLQGSKNAVSPLTYVLIPSSKSPC